MSEFHSCFQYFPSVLLVSICLSVCHRIINTFMSWWVFYGSCDFHCYLSFAFCFRRCIERRWQWWVNLKGVMESYGGKLRMAAQRLGCPTSIISLQIWERQLYVLEENCKLAELSQAKSRLRIRSFWYENIFACFSSTLVHYWMNFVYNLVGKKYYFGLA